MTKYILIYPEGDTCDLEIISLDNSCYYFLTKWHNLEDCDGIGYKINFEDIKEKFNLN